MGADTIFCVGIAVQAILCTAGVVMFFGDKIVWGTGILNDVAFSVLFVAIALQAVFNYEVMRKMAETHAKEITELKEELAGYVAQRPVGRRFEPKPPPYPNPNRTQYASRTSSSLSSGNQSSETESSTDGLPSLVEIFNNDPEAFGSGYPQVYVRSRK